MHRRHSWWDSVKTLTLALLLALGVRTVLFQPFWIPSGSMKETLLVGDFLFVNKFAYGWSWVSCPMDLCRFQGRIWGAMPERGDIVVFRHPTNGDDYIKRLIGLPGDTIRLQRGVVYLNGEPLPQEQTEDFVEAYAPQGSTGARPRCANRPQPDGECHKERAIETLPNGVSYPVLNISDLGFADTTDEFTVPEGHVFVMGDNRDNSLDSRYALNRGGVGFVPLDNLVGRADRVLFSSAGASLLAFWTWRPDRFLHALH